MAIAYNASVIINGLGFYVDFANSKSVTGVTLTDMAGNQLPISIINTGTGSLSVANGYADFNPVSNTSTTATFYTISNSYFTDNRTEITLETAMYVYQDFGNSSFVRGVSPRVTESGSPLGFSLGSTSITAEINTGSWVTSNTATPLISGYNKWYHITQTTSASAGQMKTYVNSVLVNTVNFTGTPTTGNGYLIGRGFFGGFHNYSGRVGFVRFYNRVLSQDEITSNFNTTRGRYGI
jgi:hypothetical protein